MKDKTKKEIVVVPLKKRLKRYFPLYLLALPAVIYLFIDSYIPMYGLSVAFKNYRYDKGIWDSPWVGLKNFEFLFKTKDVWLITRNTILYNMMFILLGTVCSITAAILLNEIRSKIAKKAYQTIILLPYLLSMVVISYIVYGFLSPDLGLANHLLETMGKERVSWYSVPKYWPFILVFVRVWHGVGYKCIVYLASLVGIDRGYYEAAEIDGASAWQKITQITLPCLKPTIIIMVLLSLGRVFYSDFGLFYQVPLNSGPLYNVTTTIDTYVYRGLTQTPNISMAAAAGFYQSVMGFILVLAANAFTNRFNRESSLF